MEEQRESDVMLHLSWNSGFELNKHNLSHIVGMIIVSAFELYLHTSLLALAITCV